jgi:hypothetical protein
MRRTKVVQHDRLLYIEVLKGGRTLELIGGPSTISIWVSNAATQACYIVIATESATHFRSFYDEELNLAIQRGLNSDDLQILLMSDVLEGDSQCGTGRWKNNVT